MALINDQSYEEDDVFLGRALQAARRATEERCVKTPQEKIKMGCAAPMMASPAMQIRFMAAETMRSLRQAAAAGRFAESVAHLSARFGAELSTLKPEQSDHRNLVAWPVNTIQSQAAGAQTVQSTSEETWSDLMEREKQLLKSKFEAVNRNIGFHRSQVQSMLPVREPENESSKPKYPQTSVKSGARTLPPALQAALRVTRKKQAERDAQMTQRKQVAGNAFTIMASPAMQVKFMAAETLRSLKHASSQGCWSEALGKINARFTSELNSIKLTVSKSSGGGASAEIAMQKLQPAKPEVQSEASLPDMERCDSMLVKRSDAVGVEEPPIIHAGMPGRALRALCNRSSGASEEKPSSVLKSESWSKLAFSDSSQHQELLAWSTKPCTFASIPKLLLPCSSLKSSPTQMPLENSKVARATVKQTPPSGISAMLLDLGQTAAGNAFVTQQQDGSAEVTEATLRVTKSASFLPALPSEAYGRLSSFSLSKAEAKDLIHMEVGGTKPRLNMVR
eukprot:TRINITY_DN62690_c0_g1_i1.p1 TRINITY_DN62690_c0_g1~~TRINITY_DN62690_c0_g1_i1.p1  ORF type:complete len:524 (+),score=118.45 TRINITY_DN62690_c0_g1_i1:53-1573(+)